MLTMRNPESVLAALNWRPALLLLTVVTLLAAPTGGRQRLGRVHRVSPCQTRLAGGGVVNLAPLQRLDGKPRFHVATQDWNYTFNPCTSYNLPLDPHDGLGDGCHYVGMCKSQMTSKGESFYTMGIQSKVKFSVQQVVANVTDHQGDNSTQRHFVDIKEPGEHMDTGKQEVEVDSKQEEEMGQLGEEGDDTSLEDNMATRQEVHSSSHDTDIHSDTDSITFDLDDTIKNEGAISRRKSPTNKLPPPAQSSTLVLKYRGIRSLRRHHTHIRLLCDMEKTTTTDAVFRQIDSGMVDEVFELHHKCCCINGCPLTDTPLTKHAIRHARTKLRGTSQFQGPLYSTANGSLLTPQVHSNHGATQERGASASLDKPGHMTEDGELVVVEVEYGNSLGDTADNTGLTSIESGNDSQPLTVQNLEEEGPKYIWIILVANLGILSCAMLIGGMCCRKGGGYGPYNMLPALRSGSRLTLASVESERMLANTPVKKSPDYLDYSTPMSKIIQLPLLADCVIPSHQLEIGQRLGGGLFGDTYMSEWGERRVAVKRISVGVHQNQLEEEDCAALAMEVGYLSHQRHKYLVTLIGICLDLRQPHLVTEFVDGESLKDKLHKEDPSLSWTRKVKICQHVAEALNFLHSSKYPILHRDLRCANILLDKHGKTKVGDFGVTKLAQRKKKKVPTATLR